MKSNDLGTNTLIAHHTGTVTMVADGRVQEAVLHALHLHFLHFLAAVNRQSLSTVHL